MMKKLLILFSLFGVMILIQAQSRIEGRVRTEDNIPLENILIINIKTGIRTHSSNEGTFSIEVKVGDEVRFVKKGYDRLSYIVKSGDLGQNKDFTMLKTPTEIPEVVVSKISKKSLEKLKESIGVPAPIEKSRPKVADAKKVLLPILAGRLDIQSIYDLASGDARRKKNLYKYEDFQDKVMWIQDRVESNFFLSRGVPEERITEFISFAITERNDIIALIKKRNILKVEEVLERVLPKYLARLNEKKK